MISRRRLAFPLFGLLFAAQAFAQDGAAAEPSEPKVEAPATVPKWGMFEAKISGLPANTEGIAAVFTVQEIGRAHV